MISNILIIALSFTIPYNYIMTLYSTHPYYDYKQLTQLSECHVLEVTMMHFHAIYVTLCKRDAVTTHIYIYIYTLSLTVLEFTYIHVYHWWHNPTQCNF